MARGNISLAAASIAVPIFCLLLLLDQRLYIVNILFINVSKYELPLLPNNTADEILLHKSGAPRRFLTGYLSLGWRPGGNWTNT